jgi:hypothetical protein
VQEEEAPNEAVAPQRRARIRFLLSDGTVTEPTGDSHLLDRLEYLADNLFPDDDRSGQPE